MRRVIEEFVIVWFFEMLRVCTFVRRDKDESVITDW